MAYQKYYGYQYETSPRKVQPEYRPDKNNNKYKKDSTAKKENKVSKEQQNQKRILNKKIEFDSKTKIILYIAGLFVVLFGISYRNSLISERCNEREKLKTQLSAVQKENEQLRVNIESSLNLNYVEQIAKEKLGMKKLDNSQKVYVNLPKKDYIESASEKVVIEEDLNIWQKIWKGLTQSLK